MKVYEPIQQVWVTVGSLNWENGSFVVYDLIVDSLTANGYIVNWVLVDVKIG
ncbi:MAG: hypothetical protein HY296_02350 [Thaumarchaeota archaeon]|nr:hypothetical protein [Nitrososphaerota archaeon]